MDSKKNKNPQPHDKYLGIDPGNKGAVAILQPFTGVLEIEDLPIIKEEGYSREFSFLDECKLSDIIRLHSPKKSFVERVYGIKGDSAAGAFTFGCNFGAIRATLRLNGIDVDYFPPATWKAGMNLSSDKKLSRELAKKIFPAYSKLFTRGDKAEAALIALYGIMKDGIKYNKQ